MLFGDTIKKTGLGMRLYTTFNLKKSRSLRSLENYIVHVLETTDIYVIMGTHRLGIVDYCCPQGVFRVCLSHAHQGGEESAGADSLRDKHHHSGHHWLAVSEGPRLIKDDGLDLRACVDNKTTGWCIH